MKNNVGKRAIARVVGRAARFAIAASFAISITALFAISLSGCPSRGTQTHGQAVSEAVGKIEWFGISSMRIVANGKVIYVDPTRYRPGDKADIILVTHLHTDHFNYAKAKALSKEGTVVIAPYPLGNGNKILKPGKSVTVKGVRVEATPAYEPGNKAYHLKLEGNAGYVIESRGVRIFHAGPTDAVPELDRARADIAILSVDNARKAGESAKLARSSGASVVIPIDHYLLTGEKPALEAFKAELGSTAITVAVPRLMKPTE